ncbi:MAG: cytochrome c biogenesis protein ResB [Chloroflexi bacterium]|nr:cytochrome c biogenesis protein ResB [Chloroflexota bacterium]
MTRLWQLLLSVRTALVLILLLTAVTFAGTMVIQLPANIPLGSTDHVQWLEKVRPRFGMWTDLLAMAGLFTVFRAWWYQLLVVALLLSVGACSIHRWHVITREVFHPHVRVAPALFDRPGTDAADLALDQRTAADALRRVLAGRGHRVIAEEREGRIHVYADRHRYARFGSLIGHVSLVLLLATAALGSRVGWSDDGFVVPEGSTRELALDGLSVQVTSFAAEYYPTGQPKDFRSDLVILSNGQEVSRKTIRVNDPLDHNGIRFYQSFFGPAAYLRVTDAAGRVVFEDGVALAWRAEGERPVGSVRLPEQDVTAYVIAPSAGGKGDALISPGEMRLEIYRGRSETPVRMETVAQGEDLWAAGLTFTFVREKQFTGLRVARDPTVPLIWLGSSLLVIGVTAVLCFPTRRLWALVRPSATGSRVAILTVGRRDVGQTEEIAAILSGLPRLERTSPRSADRGARAAGREDRRGGAEVEHLGRASGSPASAVER